MGLEPPNDWQDQLQTSLRRAQDAMQRGVQQQDQMVAEWTASLRTAYPEWGRERWQRRMEKKLRRRAEQEAKIANASLFEGYLWVLGAVVLLIAALSALPVLWWLLFPAASLGSRGTKVIGRHVGATRPIAGLPQPAPVQQGLGQQQQPQSQSAEAQAAEARARRFGNLGPLGALGDDLRSLGSNLRDLTNPRNVIDGANQRGAYGGAIAPAAGAPPAQDPRDVRVDAVAEKILSELRTSPASVREIFRKPEETVHALRDTCRDLTRRERDVRRFLSPEEDARLTREREALQRRVEAEADDVTKLRLASALAALDQQRAQRLELARSASRFEAEHTRISYTLESLFTQVVRMRSSDAGSVDVAGAGLRRSLDMLSQDVNELADALEKVNVEHQATGDLEAQKLRAAGQAGPGAAPAADAGRPGAPNAREKA